MAASFVIGAVSACSRPQPVAPKPSPGPPAVVEPVVSTFAGNGRLRADDGPNAGAAFLFPYGIAAAPDGSVYVSDAGAQAIRKISHGHVEFVAGNALLGATEQNREGGYSDGPAMAARFSWPTGLAVAGDGSLYIADTGNFCIRRLKDGSVTTFAGAREAGDRDGYAGNARFLRPLGLAFDDAGNLYVADFGVGIRRVSPDGVVQTLDLPSTGGRVQGVAVSGSGPNLVIAYTEDQTLRLWSSRNARAQTLLATDRVEPIDDVRYAGSSFYAVAILGPKALVVTDLQANVVRFVRFADPPFNDYATTRVIAGTNREGDGTVGGYSDGASTSSRIDVPLGITRMPDGTILFTDAGNRRIRAISGLDPRGPVGPDLANLYGPPGNYRVALVGNSLSFSSVLWPESIAGRIEAALNGSRSSLGRHAFVSSTRLDGSSISDQIDFVKEHLGDGEADLVVLLASDLAQQRELQRADARGGRWRPLVRQRLHALEATLARHHTQLLVVLVPAARSVSMSEVPEIGGLLDGVVWPLQFDQDRGTEQMFESYYGHITSHVLKIQDAAQRWEAQTKKVPLYNTRDIHLSPSGATWIGDTIATEILRWKPWRVRS